MPSKHPRSTLFTNGRILTGEGLLGPDPQYVDSLLVENGVILAIGDDATQHAASGTPRVDLEGRFTMPGFNDAHLHLGEGARLLREVDLGGTRSLHEALERIARAAGTGEGWLTGGGWDETCWPGSPLPSRHDLDRVTGDRPALFVRTDVHVSVANSAALRLGGVTRNTEAPEGSAIDRDQNGEPTGILRERAARLLVEQHIAPASLAQRKQDLRTTLASALALGITSVQDNSTDEDFAALRALHAAGELPLRVSEWLPFHASLEELEARRKEAPSDRFLRTTMLKAFLDGSLGSRTASLLAPYTDAPETTGIPLYAEATLIAMALERAALGFQLGFHAIGDRAFHMAIAAFSAVKAAHPRSRGRFRVEHAQLGTEQSFREMRELGAIASMQPAHLLTDARWVTNRIGRERASLAYAWRSFAAAGVPLAFGTDYPVEPLSPLRGLYAAITRESETGGDPFFPEQTLTLAEALHASTQGGAYAEYTESWKGRLSPGCVADFIVLDHDPFAAADQDPKSLLTLRVLRTVVDGQTVSEGRA